NEGIASGCNMNSCSVVTTGIEMNDANEKSKIAIIVYDNKGNIDSIPHTSAGYIDTSFYGDEYEAGYAALYDNDAVYVAGKAGDKNQNDFLLIKAILETSPAKKIKPLPADYSLKVYPNPAHGSITLNYTLAQPAMIRFELTSLNGNQTFQLLQRASAAGAQQATMRLPLNIAKGVYTLKMVSKEGVSMRMVVVE
ncbi:MAG TPA: T9SS type A sorting domain-containing protein, partial [Parafilimonas sp.]|nr:T9SS type A sorting domain-containing protein [Parafilimonas sp.]